MKSKESRFVYFGNRVHYALYCLVRSVLRSSEPMLEEIYENKKAGPAIYSVTVAMCFVVGNTIYLLQHGLLLILGINARLFFRENSDYIHAFNSVLVLLFMYFILWRKDKYLDYFKIFEEESFTKHMAWNICTFTYCIVLFMLLFALP